MIATLEIENRIQVLSIDFLWDYLKQAYPQNANTEPKEGKMAFYKAPTAKLISLVRGNIYRSSSYVINLPKN